MIKFVSDQIQNSDKNLTQANAYSKKFIFYNRDLQSDKTAIKLFAYNCILKHNLAQTLSNYTKIFVRYLFELLVCIF